VFERESEKKKRDRDRGKAFYENNYSAKVLYHFDHSVWHFFVWLVETENYFFWIQPYKRNLISKRRINSKIFNGVLPQLRTLTFCFDGYT
jgi:hypothetical protein